MSDSKNSGGNRKSSNDKKLKYFEKNSSLENFNSNNRNEDDIRLYNNFIHTTNSLLYDGSYSVCSTPDSAPEGKTSEYLSLPNIYDCFSHNPSVNDNFGLKKDEINLSCEDCNIMEELLPYPTHLSLYEVEQQKLSNSLIESRNTHRYDEFLSLNSDEQTDVETCERESDLEFANGDNSKMFSKSESDMKNMFYEEIDSILDPKSAQIHLGPRHEPINADDNFSDYHKANSNSASEAGASCHSMNDYSPNCDITTEDATTHNSSKSAGNLGQSSRALSRYEIMKQRKIAKSQRKHSKDSLLLKTNKNCEDNIQESIEELVSFIEGKDPTVQYTCNKVEKGIFEDGDSRLRIDTLHHSSSTRSKKQSTRKKKRKEKSLTKSETVGNSGITEYTFITPSESLANSKSSSVENEIPLVIGEHICSCHDFQSESFNNSTNISESNPDDHMPSICGNVFDLLEETKSYSVDACQDLFSNSCNEVHPRDNQSNDDVNNNRNVNCSNNNSINNGDIPTKPANRTVSLVKESYNLSIVSNWSGISTYDVVDGFPEMMVSSGDGKGCFVGLENTVNSNFNNYNNNDLISVDKKFKIENNNDKINSTESFKKLAEAEEDKLTEFSYSTNTNSSVHSCDELSSKESEAEEFVMVQKKKKVRPFRRFHGDKMNMERKIKREKLENNSKFLRSVIEERGRNHFLSNVFEDKKVLTNQVVNEKLPEHLSLTVSKGSQQNQRNFENVSTISNGRILKESTNFSDSSNVNHKTETCSTPIHASVLTSDEAFKPTQTTQSFDKLDNEAYHKYEDFTELLKDSKECQKSSLPNESPTEGGRHAACPHDISCVDNSINNTVFFDTRSLSSLESAKHGMSSGISFIFEDHFKDSSGISNKPHSPSKTSRSKMELDTTRVDENSNYNNISESNHTDSLPVHLSTCCSIEDDLNSSEKDKSLQSVPTELLDPNIIVFPKQVYACPDNMILSMPYLPYASSSAFESYPVGMSTSSESIMDVNGTHTQMLPQGSEQLIANSTFHLQHSLPIISPLFAPYNYYVAVMSSLSHDTPFLANHSQFGYGEVGCETEGGEILMVPNYSDFPYHRRLGVQFEGLNSLPPTQPTEGHAPNQCPIFMSPTSSVSDSTQTSISHFDVHDTETHSNNDAAMMKNCDSDVASDSRESNCLAATSRSKVEVESAAEPGVEHLYKKDYNNPFGNKSSIGPTHSYGYEIETNKNASSTIKKNVMLVPEPNGKSQTNRGVKIVNHPHSDWNEKNGNGFNEPSKDGTVCCCGGGGSGQKSMCVCNDRKSRSLSATYFQKSKVSFNLESAQLYLLNMFKAATREENCAVYYED